MTRPILIDKDSAKEVKIFRIGNHLIKRWSKSYMENATKSLKLAKKEQYAEFSLEGLKTIFYIAIAYLIIKLIRTDSLKVGDYVAVLQAVQQVQSTLYRTSNNISSLFEEALYLKEFFSFIDLDEHESNIRGTLNFPTPLTQGIEIKNLSFSYKSKSSPVLKNVSLKIKPGERIAIVGENGCGKSTFVKVLMGLYQYNNGEILVDNVPLNEISEEEVQKNITVLFQNFTKYPYNVYDNIGFGNISLINDKDSVESIAKITGVDNFISELKDKYNTYLSRILYEGAELSGGQWQKIAYTRALYRNSQIIILDEPTASMDPLSEKDVFEQINKVAKNKTIIFISHRMSATLLADRIVVMSKGQISETGTFSELMSKEGEFYEMFNSQTIEPKDKSQIGV